ncbi:hypothetical protein IJ556_00725, partial [bacterium]|nr:hypothetical protein [bacterium]
KTLTTSIDTLKKEISVKQDILDCNRDFPAVYDAISALKEEEDKLARASSLLSEMDGIRQLSNTIGETLRRVVSEIEQVPMEQVTNKMKQFIALADSTERVYKIFSDTSRVESRLSLVKEKADKATRDSVKSSQLLQGFQKKIDSLIKQEAMVSSIDVAESVFKEAQKKVWDCHKKASALPSNLLSFEKQVLLQKQVAAVEQGETWLSERRKATIEVMNAASGMKRSREALATVIARLNESDKELEFLKQQLGICPFCGASFDTSCAHSI